jgi:hypothetical protein
VRCAVEWEGGGAGPEARGRPEEVYCGSGSGGGPQAAPPREGGSRGRSILARAAATATTAVGEGPIADMVSRCARPGPYPSRPAQ